MIRSSPLFILSAQAGPGVLRRTRAACGAKRHPDNIQLVGSDRRSGDFQIWNDSALGSNWLADNLRIEPEGEIETGWASTRADLQPQAGAGDRDRVVVSFHTVPDHRLIEERPVSAEMTSTRPRGYPERS